MNNFTQHSFRPQSSLFKKGKGTCPICGNTHRYHCSVTVDDTLALCKYKWSERQAKDGRYIHLLRDKPSSPFSTEGTAATAANIREYSVAETKRADAKQLHPVYYAFLSCLSLTPAHGDDLLRRGLSDTVIAANLYASVPDEETGARKARALAHIYDLTAVPGFYRREGRWQVSDYHKGYYIPYRNHLGHIIGLQIHLDDNTNGKYRWFSSKDLPYGTAQSQLLHFAAPDLVKRSGEIIITEGALKADIISQHADTAVVAVAGVTAVRPAALAQVLRRVFSTSLRRAVLAFDIDWQFNLNVKTALLDMKRGLESTGLPVAVRVWNVSLGKGYDDALVSAERIAA